MKEKDCKHVLQILNSDHLYVECKCLKCKRVYKTSTLEVSKVGNSFLIPTLQQTLMPLKHEDKKIINKDFPLDWNQLLHRNQLNSIN